MGNEPMEKEIAFISTLMIAISNCSLYSKEHESFDDLAKKILSLLKEVSGKDLELMIIENDLVINKTPVRAGGLNKTNLMKRLRRKGISHIDFMEGVTLPEIKQLIMDIAQNSSDVKSCPHIKTGSVHVKTGAHPIHADSGQFSASDQVDRVTEVFHSASPFKKINIVGLEEVVVHFITTFKEESSILKYLSPVKSFSEYTYTHATNVAVLSVFQAESLGIQGELLHEIGIAALLHDAGKLFISRDVLEKPGTLDDNEFNEIKKHPLYGAAYLSKMTDVPHFASIIAFEHHRKFDGSGYPGLMISNDRQHICSQIVALADFFDALRSRRPYRESMEIKDIFVIMQKGSGTDFNPFLVDNFFKIMKSALN
jgi:HD-GYP domain-containing protein (c-di-GMP phosphodiesterase class II)